MDLGFHVRREGDEWRVHTGPAAPAPTVELPPGRRLIFIPAVPSSGTSCVAGILHHLGVDMGNVRSVQNERRGYAMYEDLDIGMFTFSPNAPLDSLLNQRVRFREYINYRLYKARNERPLGIKTLSTVWLYDHDPASLPVRVLDVHRPLEVALTSDMRRMATRPQRVAEEVPATAFQHINRAGGVAANWEAKLMLFQFLAPELTVSFDSLRKEPEPWVRKINEVFGLDAPERDIRRAIYSVREA